MTEKNSEFTQDDTETSFTLNPYENNTIRDQCYARTDYYRTQSIYRGMIYELEQKLQDQQHINDNLNQIIELRKQLEIL